MLVQLLEFNLNEAYSCPYLTIKNVHKDIQKINKIKLFKIIKYWIPLYVKCFLEYVAINKLTPKKDIINSRERFIKLIYYFFKLKNFSYFPKNLVEYKKKNNHTEIPI